MYVHPRYYAGSASTRCIRKQSSNGKTGLCSWGRGVCQVSGVIMPPRLSPVWSLGLLLCHYPALISHLRHTSNQAHNLLRNPLVTTEKPHNKREQFLRWTRSQMIIDDHWGGHRPNIARGQNCPDIGILKSLLGHEHSEVSESVWNHTQILKWQSLAHWWKDPNPSCTGTSVHLKHLRGKW